ncbi:MAG: cytochrome-c peroxidase [Chitinophagaceae bacterium]|nr:MAG: cytochrome-c peroxidase [Chitinophagaceae bacterium]
MDRSISCGSCHNPAAAFADNRAVSIGINNCAGTRNAFPLFNLAWQHTFMWDGSSTDVERSSLNALTNACEMGNTLPNIVTRLQGMPGYPALFQSAFGTSEVTEDRVFKALTQFVGSMVSANSKYDRVKRAEQNTTFTSEEQAGYGLFLQKCGSCHTEPFFTDETFRNNGLDLVSADAGRALITLKTEDVGKFRIPSLRNVQVTGPYMHDGRFNNLMQVLDHYASGVKKHSNLDPELDKADGPGFPMSNQDKNNIIAFLRTLTDTDFLADVRFRRPPN